MNIAQPVRSEISKIHFSFYEGKDIQKLSVKQITNPLIFDTLGHPTSNGLYDLALGPFDKHSVCKTCFLDHTQCPGHFGHIDLLLPCYNPITFRYMYKLLKSKCHYCNKLRLSSLVVKIYVSKLRLIHAGLLVEAMELDNLINFKPTEEDNEQEESTPNFSQENVVEKLDHYVSKALKQEKKFVKVLSSYKGHIDYRCDS
jgi:DNA-directed RNA polymerase I subunit RPA1